MGHERGLVGVEGVAAIDAAGVDAHHQDAGEGVELRDGALDVALAVHAGDLDATGLGAARIVERPLRGARLARDQSVDGEHDEACGADVCRPQQFGPRRIAVNVIAPGAIERQLRIEAKRVPQPPVQFRADKQTEYREVMKLMAAAKNAGMKKVGLITTPAR